MKTYKETKEAVKQLIVTKGLNNLINQDINDLKAKDHNSTNITNAINYFKFSPQAEKYRAV